MPALMETGQESPAKLYVFEQRAFDFDKTMTCGIDPKSAVHTLEQRGFMRLRFKPGIGAKVNFDLSCCLAAFSDIQK